VLHASAFDTLQSWIAPDEAQELLKIEYLDHLRAHDDAMWRSCTFGHLTGSAIVVNAERTAVALLFHPRVGRWLQAGGHCEAADESLMAVAWREATEEFGVAGLVISPARRAHRTDTLMFAFVVSLPPTRNLCAVTNRSMCGGSRTTRCRAALMTQRSG
jgi:hypothetical protein